MSVVEPRPMPAAPLVVQHSNLIVMPRPLGGAATLPQQEKSNLADAQRSRLNVTGFICTRRRLIFQPLLRRLLMQQKPRREPPAALPGGADV